MAGSWKATFRAFHVLDIEFRRVYKMEDKLYYYTVSRNSVYIKRNSIELYLPHHFVIVSSKCLAIVAWISSGSSKSESFVASRPGRVQCSFFSSGLSSGIYFHILEQIQPYTSLIRLRTLKRRALHSAWEQRSIFERPPRRDTGLSEISFSDSENNSDVSSEDSGEDFEV